MKKINFTKITFAVLINILLFGLFSQGFAIVDDGSKGFSPKVITSDEFLIKKCKEIHGEIVNHWTCPYSGDERDDVHCMVKDNEKRPMYFNGCTGAFGKYSEVFFPACVYHDLCYHHEPTSNNLQREDCDSKFYNNMFKICDTRPKDDDCADAARWYYNAVATFGKNAWICSKEKANYPRNEFWIQQLLSSK